MSRLRSQCLTRRGGIAPMTAFLLIPLLGMVAFAVDLGWIALVQSDLQNAADSAALAGAGQLMNGYIQYNLPGQSANQATIISTAETGATSSAKQFASLNAAGVSSLTLLNGDIEYGFTDANGNYTASSSGSTIYPNTIKVSLRRDSSANTPLGLFFGPVLGLSTVNLKATAAATIYTANIDSFANTSTLKVGMLPVTYDVNSWNNFLKTGQDSDGDPATTDSSSNPDLSVYPSVKDTGNFGLLGLDDSHAGASTVSGWITSGLTQTELSGLLSASANDQTPLIPLSQHNQTILPSASTDGLGSWNWVGDTGMKTSVIHTLDNYVGDTFLLPLFTPLDPGTTTTTTTTTTNKKGQTTTTTTTTTTPYTAGSGNGSHYYYNIVQFVSVKLVSADDKSVVVEPSAQVLDLNQVLLSGAATPAGAGSSSSGTVQTTFTPPKLTQ